MNTVINTQTNIVKWRSFLRDALICSLGAYGGPEALKQIKAIKISLKGINAVAGGLIAVAAVILMQKSGFSIDNLMVTAVTIVLLFSKKIPAPLIVIFALGLGFVV